MAADTNQVIMYQGIYLGFPAAFQHLPSPPAWHTDNDGLFDTRILHSAFGRSWSYIADDRGAFFGRGPSFRDLLDSSGGVPSPRDASTWRESMTTIVRGGPVIRSNATMDIFVWGARRTHYFTASQHVGDVNGAGGTIARVPMRRDGWASIRSDSSSWLRPGLMTTKPFIFEGSRLLLNAHASNGGGIRVALLPASVQSGAAEGGAGERTLESCVPVGGDVFSAAVEWRATGRDVAQLAVRLRPSLRPFCACTRGPQ